MPTMIEEKVVIDGKIFVRHIDSKENSKIERFIVGEKKMQEIGIRLDSYSARVEQGRKGPMAGAIQARNHKNGLSSNQRRAVKTEKEQRILNQKKHIKIV